MQARNAAPAGRSCVLPSMLLFLLLGGKELPRRASPGEFLRAYNNFPFSCERAWEERGVQGRERKVLREYLRDRARRINGSAKDNARTSIFYPVDRRFCDNAGKMYAQKFAQITVVVNRRCIFATVMRRCTYARTHTLCALCVFIFVYNISFSHIYSRVFIYVHYSLISTLDVCLHQFVRLH